MKYVTLLFACLAAYCAAAQNTASAAARSGNPVFPGWYADPEGVVFGDTYWIYPTYSADYDEQTFLDAFSSKDLVHWQKHPRIVSNDEVKWVKRAMWAPAAVHTNGKYYLFFAGNDIHEGETGGIGVSVADSPAGPFRDALGKPLIDSIVNGAQPIDQFVFRDDDGKIYLYFVSTGAWSLNGYTTTAGNNIWGGEFDLDTCTFVSGPKLLIAWGSGEWNVNEGPEMLKHNGIYYLTYSVQGYSSPTYAVRYATSDSPTGDFVKHTGDAVLITADPSRADPNNNLYGTAHHCFTQLADGSLVIVYHAHRSGTASELLTEASATYVEERRVCIDKAWFDADGVLRAGDVNNVGHPTVTADVAPTGESAARSVTVDDNFAALATLPTVYVSMYDGKDENNGSKTAPFRTLDAAYAALPNGGTIVLRQKYDMQSSASVTNGHCTDNAYYASPKVNGPIMIRGEFSAVPVLFKFWSIQSDTYLDNIELRPRTTGTTASGIAVIECGQNNVVIGEGVSCAARPNSEQFPVLVGGYWQYNAESASSPYKYYAPSRRPSSMLTTDKAYSLTVLGGTWSIVTAGSARNTTQLGGTAPNATLTLGEDAKIRPAKMGTVTASLSGAGAVLTYPEINHAVKYRICDGDGNLVGYSDTTSFTDTTYTLGETKTYTVAGYVNGACIGDASAAVSISSYGDMNGDGAITIADALLLLTDILNGKTTDAGLVNVLLLLKACV